MSSEEEINGVKIQRLPTVGRPMSMKSTRFRPARFPYEGTKEKAKKLEAIARVLQEKDKEKK